MLNKVVKIATRQSPLAIWQAQFVQYQLMTIYPNLHFELLSIVSEGDINLDKPLMKVGGKRLFIKELEVAILENRADLAVHSMKDVPGDFPKGLGLVTICKRGDPRDAFVSNCYNNVDNLPKGGIIGTSSLRRQCQISAYRPDLVVRSMRGNVDTRLNKLDSGECDAIILAAAGLKRLGLKNRIRQIFSAEFSLPTVGQGAVGIECRLDDIELITLLQVLHHSDTAVCICAERAMNKHLEGGCQVPIGSFAILKDNQLWLRGLVGTPDGRQIIVGERYGPREEAAQIGVLLAEELLKGGARAILCANY